MEKVEELTMELNRKVWTKRACRGITKQDFVSDRNRDHKESRRGSHLSDGRARQLQGRKEGYIKQDQMVTAEE